TSISRYVLAAVPVFLVLARAGERPVFGRVWTIVSLLWFALYGVLYVPGFWLAGSRPPAARSRHPPRDMAVGRVGCDPAALSGGGVDAPGRDRAGHFLRVDGRALDRHAAHRDRAVTRALGFLPLPAAGAVRLSPRRGRRVLPGVSGPDAWRDRGDHAPANALGERVAAVRGRRAGDLDCGDAARCVGDACPGAGRAWQRRRCFARDRVPADLSDGVFHVA